VRLTSLSLEQFRSYAALSLTFPPKQAVHLFVGPNAAGKTNILEALSVLGLTKSFQGADEGDLLHWDTEYYRVCANIESDDGSSESLEVVSQILPRKQKVCYRNDVKVSIGEMVGVLPIVQFLPQDLDLFSGSPHQRRLFLDRLLSQVSLAYLRALAQMQEVLKQRNSLLRSIADGVAKPDDLAVWDDQFASQAAQVTMQRLELIEVLQCTIAEELSALGESFSDVKLVYHRKSEARDHSILKAEIVALLLQARKRDIILQSTSVGPHREDWQLTIQGRPLPAFASRGQQRAAVLALNFLQVSFLELRRGEKPVVLLDDVFSELDDKHQSALLANLSDHQVFITATHVPTQLHGAEVWKVEEGKVKSEAVKQYTSDTDFM